MQITATTLKNATVVELAGRMDAMTTAEFDRWFSEQVASGGFQIILNLQELDYISSAGLRSLLAAAKQLNTKNGSLLLCCIKGTVEEVFKISGFLSILPTFPSVEEACASLKQESKPQNIF